MTKNQAREQAEELVADWRHDLERGICSGVNSKLVDAIATALSRARADGRAEAADLLRQAQAALKPFAKAAKGYAAYKWDGVENDTAGSNFKVGALREAARVHALLGGQKK